MSPKHFSSRSVVTPSWTQSHWKSGSKQDVHGVWSTSSWPPPLAEMVRPVCIWGRAISKLYALKCWWCAKCILTWEHDTSCALLYQDVSTVVKTKCAAFYKMHSEGNHWYKSKSDKLPTFTILQKPIRVYSCHEIYSYLGHKINVAGDWEEQLTELTSDCSNRLDLIDFSSLPSIMKTQAIREITLAKIQHLFENLHISQNILTHWMCE